MLKAIIDDDQLGAIGVELQHVPGVGILGPVLQDDGGDADHIVDQRRQIANAKFESGKLGMWTDVPPNASSVVDAAGANQRGDEPLELLIAFVAFWNAGARQAFEDHRARGTHARLAAAEKKIAQLELESVSLKEELDRQTLEKDKFVAEHEALSGERTKLGQELKTIRETAGNTLAIDSENKIVRAKVVGMEQELQILKAENEVLADETSRDWFVVGAGAVILGILLGLIIPKLRLQKRGSWDSLS